MSEAETRLRLLALNTRRDRDLSKVEYVLRPRLQDQDYILAFGH